MLQVIRRLWSLIKRRPVNHQRFKLAAPGTGVLIFRQSTASTKSLEVLLSVRSTSAGGGYGYTGGGFVECGDVAALPVGSFLHCADELVYIKAQPSETVVLECDATCHLPDIILRTRNACVAGNASKGSMPSLGGRSS